MLICTSALRKSIVREAATQNVTIRYNSVVVILRDCNLFKFVPFRLGTATYALSPVTRFYILFYG